MKTTTLPRGLLTGTAAALALVWGIYLLVPGQGITGAIVQSAVYVVLVAVTVRSRRAKVVVVRTVQRWMINR